MLRAMRNTHCATSHTHVLVKHYALCAIRFTLCARCYQVATVVSHFLNKSTFKANVVKAHHIDMRFMPLKRQKIVKSSATLNLNLVNKTYLST